MNHEKPFSVARYYSHKAKAHREFESKRLQEREVLLIVQGAKDGNASSRDLLDALYPDRNRNNPYADSHHHIAEIAFARLVSKGLLHATRAQVLTKKKGPPKIEPRWELTDAGRFNLMTHSASVTARGILEQIEDIE